MTAAAMDAPRPVKVVGLISMGHCLNHMLVIVVPPLAVTWVTLFQVDYFAIGLVMAATALASAISVVPVGFLVDRVPARYVLVIGLVVLSLSTIGFGFAQSYWHLLVCGVFAGLGNTVFHPCGYSILSATVPKPWLGRAFSVHTFAGYGGFALTPIIITLFGQDWRTALILLGVLGLVVALAMLLNRDDLHDDRTESGTPANSAVTNDAGGLRLLFSLPVMMCFLFFLFTTISYWGFDSFLPASLYELHGVDVEDGNFGLSVFFGFSALGILIGGLIADRTSRHGQIAALGFSVAAVCIFLIGELSISLWTIFALIALAGIGAGVVTPSRDLIVRKVTPAGQTGKVFAFTTMAMDTGTLIAPPVFGFLLDQGETVWLFRLAAFMLILSIFTVTATRHVHGRMEKSP
ncbi:MAG: MFS transporter [Alphaproteobacteria bacterium]|jgi:MFS transporter, FSR family, fosmidomycin resistance protein|nr:MFS transporter [Rhodospirillaceae bacterium]MDG2479462.1 MFS transporter [Alphaproteobacteria bacterium]MBT6202766.1 MFS transporter [Rhodospirillaceae bacterium]MBT6512904.1 MFS transporter [Rhodospirillaceae bacterium]MBT7615383.1 MFS transporter [Rhodospirillaceae bacterium]